MQELNNDLMNEAGLDNAFKTLEDTAVKWSKYVLENNEGKALEHGLEIAKNLVNYYHATEME